MSTKKFPAGSILMICMGIGVLISFGNQPMYNILVSYIKTTGKFNSYAELIASLSLGILYLGVLIYLIVVLVLKYFSGNLFGYLMKELKDRQLLPPGFKTKQKRSISNIYEDIIKMFRNFIQVFINTKKEKDKYSNALDKYVDPSLKKQIEERGINEMYLGSKKKTVTMFFSDLRGFTAMTEFHTPEEVVMILNDYFSFATKIIQKNKGRVNKYIGDAVMAVFEEAPKYSDYKDADMAVISALDIHTQFKMHYKQWKEKIDPNLDVGLGIGLARGEIVTGNMGSEERMEYTVIGDTVNFSSRLCSLANDDQVIISEEVFNEIKDLIEVQQMEPVQVKGKQGYHNVYSVLNRKMLR